MNGNITDKIINLKNKFHTKVENYQDKRIGIGTVVKQSLFK